MREGEDNCHLQKFGGYPSLIALRAVVNFGMRLSICILRLSESSQIFPVGSCSSEATTNMPFGCPGMLRPDIPSSLQAKRRKGDLAISSSLRSLPRSIV